MEYIYRAVILSGTMPPKLHMYNHVKLSLINVTNMYACVCSLVSYYSYVTHFPRIEQVFLSGQTFILGKIVR